MPAQSAEPDSTAARSAPKVLTVNTGSSSLKAALYPLDDLAQPLAVAQIERIGGLGQVSIRLGDEPARETRQPVPNHTAALMMLFERLNAAGYDGNLRAAGHRVVHGGREYHAPHLVDVHLLAALRSLVPIDPQHLPQAIAAIEAVQTGFPSMPQVACFDTAFHGTMPAVARRLPIPRELFDQGVQRYGFHGLSYEYIMTRLRAEDPRTDEQRIVIAHLGNGCSMAAVRGGQGVDTTMGFTPTGGLMMGTRSGDLDPGVALYLLQERGMSPAALSDLVNAQSGLRGVSGGDSDMRDLLAREEQDAAAREAVDLFCYTARKYLGALTAVLGGLDALVFTGGIGEHAAPVRARITDGLEFLGITIDPDRNARQDAVISASSAPVTVRVMHTDEDQMIARHTVRLLGQEVR